MPLNLYSKASVDNLLADKLDLAGGTMTGALTLSASGIIFSDATYLTTAPAGSTLAADQLTAGVVAANPTSGPTTAGDVLTYNGSALVWSAGGGGGGVAWGAITGTVTDQTDLVSYVTGLGYLTDAPSDGQEYVRKNAAWSVATGGGGGVAWGAITGTLSSQTDLQTELDGKLPVRSVNTQSGGSYYTLALTDANKVVYVTGTSGQVNVPDDGTVNFPVGTIITVVTENTNTNTLSPLLMGQPTINGSGSVYTIPRYVVNLVKIATDVWYVD